MKNKEFFYRQYDKINWENQEKTRINEKVNKHILNNYFIKKDNSILSAFDIGFGIGFFFKIAKPILSLKFKQLFFEGCEPSKRNYEYSSKLNSNLFVAHNSSFLDNSTTRQFDFITAIYVFPHILFKDLNKVVKKIHSMLLSKGKFILIVANEKYLKEKLKSKKDLFLEENKIKYNNKIYTEYLHYSDIPEIGKVIDYNREERFYLDLFSHNKFKLFKKENFEDQGFICTIFVFEKN